MQPANHHPPIQRSSGSYTNSVPDERVPPVFDVGPGHVPPPDREGRKLDNLCLHISKYSVILWMTILNRLPTLDRLRNMGLNVDTRCILCVDGYETRNHLFCECAFSHSYVYHIWEERNRRKFQNVSRDCNCLVNSIKESVSIRIHGRILQVNDVNRVKSLFQ
ncbi:hypothetical protein GQ457_16G028860 [Hibiscus cannabinus]